MDEINEGIADIALVLEINGEIEEVIGALVPLVNSRKEHLLTIFVWNVFDHESCARVRSHTHPLYIEHILRFVLLNGLLVVRLS